MQHTSLIPTRYRILSGSLLKLFAVITMLFDHVASVFLSKSDITLFTLGSRTLTLYKLMRLVGRTAFPLFAFLLVEGFIHTRDKKRYGIRLFLFALISEIPWNLEHKGTWLYSSQNVFFTLFLGFLGLCVLERFIHSQGEEGKKRLLYAGLLFLLFAVSVILRADYRCSGFGFIMMLYVLRESPLIRAVIGSCFLSSRWQVFPAFVLIVFYNGKRGFIRGRILSLLFYAIYPVHLIILYWIRLKTIGY